MVTTGKRPLEEGLVLDLRMSEGAGSVVHDVSGESNHGDIVGASWSAAGGLDFDGDADWVTIPYSASLDLTNTDDFTLFAEVSVDADPTVNVPPGNVFGLIGKTNKYGIDVYFTPDPCKIRGGVRDAIGQKSISYAHELVDIGFVDICFVFNASDMMYLYIDGELVGERITTDVGAFNAVSQTWTGAIVGGTAALMDGISRRIKIWKGRALFPDEVALLHAQRRRM